MKLAALFLLLFCHSVVAGTPSEALRVFQQAAKDQKFDDVWKNTAQFKGASEEVNQYLKSRVERVVKGSAEGWGFEIIDEKIEGDCAVIVINESTKAGHKAFDIDPVFMIKQDEEWKVMPDLTKWNIGASIPPDKQPASMKLDEQKVSAYTELEKWFNERSDALRKAHKR